VAPGTLKGGGVSDGGLRDWLAAGIAAHGPMPVERYMRECLMHPKFGYYRGAQAIGAAGDFITAPEISQIFGELIGIWAAAAWAGLGEPERWRLVELGPGRGTLMADLLRALKVLPAARAGVEVVLVEANGVLREQQLAALDSVGVPMIWLEETNWLGGLPRVPTVLIANEFLDALPIRQFVADGGKWRERCVDLADPANSTNLILRSEHRERLEGGLGSDASAARIGTKSSSFETSPPSTKAQEGAPQDEGGGRAEGVPPPDGAICEIMTGAAALIADLAQLSPAYMLFIDYGHLGPVFGDTLQAVSGHRFADPLAAPGEHDLSAQVDFAQVREAALASGFEAHGPVTQAEFLGRLGAAERLERLTRGKDAASVQAMQTGLARLMQPSGMGGRFKAFALASKGLASPPVF
jgi:NADH dehydrogenase [ubiquinone] 1 alpha subcomplex assembly factor 7